MRFHNLLILVTLILGISGCVRYTDTNTYDVIPIDSVTFRDIYMGDMPYEAVLNQIPDKEVVTLFAQSYTTSTTSQISIKDTVVEAFVLDNFEFPQTVLRFLSDTVVPFYSVIDSKLFVIIDSETKTLSLESDTSLLSRIQLKDYQYLILLLNTDISVVGNRIFLPYEDGRYGNWETSEGISEMYQFGKPLIYAETNRFNEVHTFGSYPDEYISNEYFGYNMTPRIAPFGDGYVLSYPAARNLVVVSADGEKIREANAESLVQIPYSQISRADFMVISKVIEWQKTTPIYGWFKFNPYLKEYYRMYQTPEKNGNIKTYNLVRLNSDLLKIGEYSISGDRYNPHVFLSTPNGFAIQLFRNSPNSEVTRNSIREFYLN